VAFAVTFTVARPGVVRHLTLLLDAPPAVVTARMGPTHLTGHKLYWSGELLFHERHTQLYLVPAVRYLFDGRPYTTLLMPYFVALLPSPVTAAHFGTALQLARGSPSSTSSQHPSAKPWLKLPARYNPVPCGPPERTIAALLPRVLTSLRGVPTRCRLLKTVAGRRSPAWVLHHAGRRR
jgi:hypothetical protein